LEAIESLVDVSDGPWDVVTVGGVSSKGGPFWVGRVAVDGGAICRGWGGNRFDDVSERFLDEDDIGIVFFCF